MAIGLDSQIGYAVEGTPGTYETVTRFLEFVPPLGLMPRQRYYESQGIRARRLPHAFSLAESWVEGRVQHELVAESIGILFEACIDSSPDTTGSDPYEHVFEAGANLASLSAQWALPSSSALHPITAAGLRARSWELTNDASGVHPMLSIDWIGELIDIDGTPSLASASYADFTRFVFQQLVIEVGGSAVCVDNVAIRGTTGYTSEFKNCGVDIEQTERPTFTGSFTADLANLTQLGRYLNGTEAAVTATWTNGSSAILEIAGNCYFPGQAPTIDGYGKTKETVDFVFFSDTDDATAFTATLTNGDSSA